MAYGRRLLAVSNFRILEISAVAWVRMAKGNIWRIRASVSLPYGDWALLGVRVADGAVIRQRADSGFRR